MNGRPTPQRLPDTPPRRPAFSGFRAEIWELLGNPERAATLRWRTNNAAKPRLCNCGAEGTVRVTDGLGGYVGSEPPAWWRCEDHASVALTVPWAGGQPLLAQSRDDCAWRTGSIATKVITDCGCGTHVGEHMS